MPPNLAQVLEVGVITELLQTVGLYGVLALFAVLIYWRMSTAVAFQTESMSKLALASESSNQDMSRRYDGLRDDLTNVRVELAKSQGIQSVLQDTLRNERQEWTRERSSLLEQINELKLQLRIVENDMKVLQGAIQNKNTEIEDLKRLKEKIEGQLQAQIDVRSREAESLQLKISELEARLDSQKIELERAKHEALYGKSGVIGDGVESGVASDGATKQSEFIHPDTGSAGESAGKGAS